MAAIFAGRSVLRSASTGVRSSASRIISAARAKPSSTGAARSPFRLPAQNPLSHRIFRSSSVALESMLPFHTATASALLTSMLSSAPYSCGWTIDDS